MVDNLKIKVKKDILTPLMLIIANEIKKAENTSTVTTSFPTREQLLMSLAFKKNHLWLVL